MKNLDRLKQIGNGWTHIYGNVLNFFIIIIIIILILLFLWCFLFVVKICKTPKNTVKFEKGKSIMSYMTLYMSKIKGYKKIISLSENSILLISEYGLFFLYVIEEIGLIEGKYDDPYLKKRGESISILNPFKELNRMYKQIEILKPTKILVTRNACFFNVPSFHDEIIIKEKDIITSFDKIMDHQKKYTKSKVDTIYKTYSVKFCQSKDNTLQS